MEAYATHDGYAVRCACGKEFTWNADSDFTPDEMAARARGHCPSPPLTSQSRFACMDRVRHRVYGAGTVVGVQDCTCDPWYSDQPCEYLPDVHVYVRFQDDAGTWKGNKWRGGFLLPQGAFEKVDT